MNNIRVRFAPSPTGHLHIGGARTALFNWLFARGHSGTFILRIEDTDVERSREDLVSGILEGMSWLGLQWDEGPVFQSQRLEHYRTLARRLLDNGHAYRDFSTIPDEDHRQFRTLTPDQVRRRLQQGEPFAVRFRVIEGTTVGFDDEVYGRIVVESDQLEDFVILRSDGQPTYHLSVVADDIEMGITHIIRGSDHVSNTGKHLLLYSALDAAPPVYAHLPLILGPDKKRLSKRHGAASVLEYRDGGFLPEAVRNYLALLGWSPGNDQELFTEQELVERFELNRINRAGAVFDLQKLEWMNGQYLNLLDAERLAPSVQFHLERQGLWSPDLAGSRRAYFLRFVELYKKGSHRVTDFGEKGRAFLTDDFQYEADAVERYLTPANPEARRSVREALEELRSRFQLLPEFELATTEAALREVAAQRQIKAGALIGAVRVAVTGYGIAPGIFEVLVAVGRDKSLERLDRAIQFLA